LLSRRADGTLDTDSSILLSESNVRT
jgi:hypothetical protein